jgi:DNA-binding NarL/FixJ family response regulator
MIEILLIEDDPGDAQLIRVMLQGSASVEFRLEVEQGLSSGLKRLDEQHFDVILLDLELPDSHGLETLRQIYSRASATPVVVITGQADEVVGAEAVRMGAQDYLVKGEIDSSILLRSIRYAIDRHRLQEKLQEKLDQERQENGRHDLEAISRSSIPSAIARSYGKVPFRESFSSKFEKIVDRYAGLLEMALEQKDFKVKHNVSREIKNIAEEMGDVGCTPHDVIEIHAAALEKKGIEISGKRLRALEETGRLELLRLMGFLASFYRQYYFKYPGEKLHQRIN